MIIIILFVFCISNIYAQDTLNFNYVNNQTYHYFETQQWTKLIILGNAALENDVDFYYLQTRLGIAYYEKKKYRKAIKYFETALKQKANDAVISEYLYFSYLFSGRELDASVLSKNFSNELKTKIGIKQPFFKSISISGLYLPNNEESSLINRDIDGDDNIYGSQQIDENRTAYSVGIENRIGNKMLVNYSFSQSFSAEKQQMKYRDTAYNFNLNNVQNKSYIKITYRAAKGLKLSFALNILNIQSSANYLTTNSSTSDLYLHNTYDSIFVPNGQRYAILDVYDTIPDYIDNYTAQTNSDNSNWTDFALAFSLWKDFSSLKLGLNFSYYKINNSRSYQPSVTLVYYPLYNLNLYLLTNINNQIYRSTDLTGSQNYDYYFIFNQTVGVKLTKNIWTELSYKQGNMQNYADNDVSSIYNITEAIKIQTGGKLIFLLFKNKLKLTLNYSLIQRENIYYTTLLNGSYTKEYNGVSHERYTYKDNNSIFWLEAKDIVLKKEIDNEELNYTTTTYYNHLITGGLTWYF